MAESCNFGEQHDSLIRDKFLFGLDDTKLRDRLISHEKDEILTLDFVVRAVRVEETSKALNSSEVNSIGRKTSGFKKYSYGDNGAKCQKCGRSHKPRRCPAYNQRCNKCGEKGHWAVKCKNSSTDAGKVNEVEEEETETPSAN